MNITPLIRRIKKLWRDFTDQGPRIYLRSPFTIWPSRKQCAATFHERLYASLDYYTKTESMTNQALADELENTAADSVAFFSKLDSLIDEAARRLRGPGAASEIAVVAVPSDPVLATRRSEP